MFRIEYVFYVNGKTIVKLTLRQWLNLLVVGFLHCRLMMNVAFAAKMLPVSFRNGTLQFDVYKLPFIQHGRQFYIKPVLFPVANQEYEVQQ